MKKIIYTKDAPEPIGPYSQAILANNMLYISGQIAINPYSGDLVLESIGSQTRQVIENLNAILTESGIDLNNIVKSSIFITDMEDFDIINEIYGSYFNDNPPAREVVEVSKLPKNANIMISATAVIY